MLSLQQLRGHILEIHENHFVTICTIVHDKKDPEREGVTLEIAFENTALDIEQLEELAPCQIFTLNICEDHESDKQRIIWDFPRWEPGEYEKAMEDARKYANEMMELWGPHFSNLSELDVEDAEKK
jgi:hypothetical protein